jgi:hypothetical protein
VCRFPSHLAKTRTCGNSFSCFAIDDFALDEEMGEVYLAGGERNTLLKVALDGGEVQMVYGE